MTQNFASRNRQVAGVAAIASLIGVLAIGGVGRPVRVPARVVASQTFSVMSEGPGHFSWTLESGRPPAGGGLVFQNALEVDRSELTALSVPSNLVTGERVPQDAIVAQLESERSGHLLDELGAERDAILAERALLLAGGRPEAIAKAERAVAVAEAMNAEDHAIYARLIKLAGTGAISIDGLEQAELRAATGLRAVELARAEVAASRIPARPEERSLLDARVELQIAEIESRIAAQRLRTPISGVVEVGGTALVRIYDVDPVYLQATLPESMRGLVAVGSQIAFSSPSLPGTARVGHIAEISETSTVDLVGRSMFLVSAEVANPDHVLRSGMFGQMELTGGQERLPELARGSLGSAPGASAP